MPAVVPAPIARLKDELDRLLKGFVERFGSLPISNAGPSRRAVASADGESA